MTTLHVTADARELMIQAGMTANTYLLDAIRSIDGAFGEGCAKSRPELVGHFIQAAAADYQAARLTDAATQISDALRTAADATAQGLDEIAERIGDLPA